jgi:hypothetical protein
MGGIGRLDGDRSRPLQAFDEFAVDVEFTPATEPKTFGVRYRDRSVLIDLDADPAFKRAPGAEIDQQAQEFLIPNGDRDATAGRRARAPRRGRNETI